ncbi:MAG TPA: ABC transporter substrate-binding protein [Dehalococcoidia bacterium]|nr:ABC transporter substrate-binding protein [Dehalococcoidia bacterium]
MEILEKKLSRRRMLQGAVVGGAGLAVAGVLGCSDNKESTTTPSTSGANVTYKDPGISASEIKIGDTGPYTGPLIGADQIYKSMTAYFKYLNETSSGVNDRKVNWLSLDDGYNPAQTVEQTRRLLDQEKVFALAWSLGTPQQQSVLQLVEAQKVPQLFINTASSIFADPKVHPYTTCGIPSYFGVAQVLAEYIVKNIPDAKIAIFSQNDNFGKDYVAGFEKGLGSNTSKIVSRQTYEVTDTSVDSQVIAMRDTNANVWFQASTGRAAVLAMKRAFELNWKPQSFLVLNNNSLQTLELAGKQTAVGAISDFYFKDARDPQYTNDPAVQQAISIVSKYESGLDPASMVNGVMSARVLVEVIRTMKEPTREGLLAAARSLKGFDAGGLMLPGISWEGSTTNNYMIQKARLAKFDGDKWVPFGDVLPIPTPI